MEDLKKTQWFGKRVAFLGDSITDAVHVGTTKNYWQYLEEELGIVPLVYGINGANWGGVLGQARKLASEVGDNVDAIFIFAGTNDYNGNVIPGEWWKYEVEEVNSHGITMPKPRRHLQKDLNTLCGRINAAMEYIRQTFARQQIVMMTPIHRAFACFGGTNVQPEETFPNDLGIYFEDYVELIRKAADIWSTPLIDLYRNSGLHPLTPSHAQFFHLPDTDLLHPNAEGHNRIAQTMLYQMLYLHA